MIGGRGPKEKKERRKLVANECRGRKNKSKNAGRRRRPRERQTSVASFTRTWSVIFPQLQETEGRVWVMYI